MLRARTGHSAQVLGDKLFVYGGRDHYQNMQSTLECMTVLKDGEEQEEWTDISVPESFVARDYAPFVALNNH